MFPFLEPHSASPASLTALGKAMIETPAMAADSGRDNPNVPAGFTYLGQFIDHDITFDTTPLPEMAVDPAAVHNFRTPKLDLDCLYGTGPAAQPFLYQRAKPGQFLIGQNPPSPDAAGVLVPALPNDLPRSADGFALIGDPRNDENLLVAQTHLAFLKFHNKIMETHGFSFDEARRMVTWHYQWIVLHDFLPKLIDPAELNRVLTSGRDFYEFDKEPFIPVEFSVAAYRLGHSMVREKYDHNRVFNSGPVKLAEATLALLFRFSGLSGSSVPVPSNWAIDWRRFFPLDTAVAVNGSRRLDPFLTPQLGNLPIPDPNPDRKNLAVRNLLRSQGMGLPSGQKVARALRLRREMLTPAEISRGTDGAVAAANGFDRSTPLWYYILKESEVRRNGLRLGPVGSRILAEVFVGLVEGDPNSYLAQEPDWTPELPGKTAGQFTMVDLLTFLGMPDINPV